MKQFICGTHYFGRGSPINMWSSIKREDLEKDIEEVKVNGFNSIVLLIPWSGFHRSLSARELDPHYISILKDIDAICSRLEISIIFRLGYLWDSTPCDQPTYHRYSSIIHDRGVFEKWLWFLNAFYEVAKDLASYDFSFISWEDFYWPIYRHYQNVKNKNDLHKFYYCSGLGGVLQRYNSFSEYFKEEVDELENAEIPSTKSIWHSVYTNHFDNVVWREIVDLSCLAFPKLSVELRVDPEWEPTRYPGASFHSWSQNHINSNLPVIYYHANIGTRADNIMNAKQANHHLAQLLDRYSPMRRLGQKKPFVDQLNFFDDTYKDWGKIDADEKEYVNNIFSTLRKLSSGYAIWGYRDWRKNIVHNPFFELGEDGWDIKGERKVTDEGLHIANGTVSQSIPHLALDEGERALILKGSCSDDLKIRAKVLMSDMSSPISFEVDVNGEFFVEKNLPEKARVAGVEVLLDGSFNLQEISVIGRSFSQGFADSSGNLTKIGKNLVEKQKSIDGVIND